MIETKCMLDENGRRVCKTIYDVPEDAEKFAEAINKLLEAKRAFRVEALVFDDIPDNIECYFTIKEYVTEK